MPLYSVVFQLDGGRSLSGNWDWWGGCIEVFGIIDLGGRILLKMAMGMRRWIFDLAKGLMVLVVDA